MFRTGGSAPRERSGVRRQRAYERRQAFAGIDALVWLYYDQHRDAGQLDGQVLRQLAALGATIGLSPTDLQATIAGREIDINSRGGVRSSDGVSRRVHTSDRWLDTLAEPPVADGPPAPPCPHTGCPGWHTWRG